MCGAGINCVGMRPDGRTARFPALGRFSGDWGGGWALAEEALWHAARAADGRGEPTALATTLPAHFGVPDMPALIEALHLNRIPPHRRHEATPVLFATAAQGDRTARAVIDQQATEIVTMATVALTRLDLLDEETPVLLGGSVLAADHPHLTEGIRTRLSTTAPKAVPHVVTARPVLGAALLGLDDVAAPPEARTNARARTTAECRVPPPVGGTRTPTATHNLPEPNGFPGRVPGQGEVRRPELPATARQSDQDRVKAGADVAPDGDTYRGG